MIKFVLKKLILSCLITLPLLMSGCATSSRYKLTANEKIAKGATGIVSIVPTDSNNTKMRVRVSHLYPAEQFQKDATNYIIWVKPEGTGTYQNVGAMQVDDLLQGEYATTIPFSSFHLLVTPEKGNLIQTPTGPAVFEKRVIR